MYHVASPALSQGSDGQSTLRHRKMTSTGGNRSWSEEEENYLLQTRRQKMPYKHIAAHLNKTELACRLHYHQLSHGSNRRKRALSNASTGSNASSIGHSPNSSQYNLDGSDFTGSYTSRNTSPMSYGSMSPFATADTSPNRNAHKVLLPKPRMLNSNESQESLLGLRINTTVPAYGQSSVDTDRLRAIYEARRAQFWTSIAAEYGSDVSPSQLEEIWRQGGHMGYRPPTPEEDIYGRPLLKPSPFPQYPSAMSPIKEFPTMNEPSRMPYMLPTPTPSNYRTPDFSQYGTPALSGLSRTSSWSTSPQASHLPATSISALLTEDRNPKP